MAQLVRRQPVTEQALPARLHGSVCEATARDRVSSAHEVAWRHRLGDYLAHQRAGNLLHATQIVSKVQKRCIRRKIFHSQCNAMSQTSQKELFLCRNSPKNVAKQENIATLSLISRQKRCFRHPRQNPPGKPNHSSFIQ